MYIYIYTYIYIHTLHKCATYVSAPHPPERTGTRPATHPRGPRTLHTFARIAEDGEGDAMDM